MARLAFKDLSPELRNSIQRLDEHIKTSQTDAREATELYIAARRKLLQETGSELLDVYLEEATRRYFKLAPGLTIYNSSRNNRALLDRIQQLWTLNMRAIEREFNADVSKSFAFLKSLASIAEVVGFDDAKSRLTIIASDRRNRKDCRPGISTRRQWVPKDAADLLENIRKSSLQNLSQRWNISEEQLVNNFGPQMSSSLAFLRALESLPAQKTFVQIRDAVITARMRRTGVTDIGSSGAMHFERTDAEEALEILREEADITIPLTPPISTNGNDVVNFGDLDVVNAGTSTKQLVEPDREDEQNEQEERGEDDGDTSDGDNGDGNIVLGDDNDGNNSDGGDEALRMDVEATVVKLPSSDANIDCEEPWVEHVVKSTTQHPFEVPLEKAITSGNTEGVSLPEVNHVSGVESVDSSLGVSVDFHDQARSCLRSSVPTEDNTTLQILKRKRVVDPRNVSESIQVVKKPRKWRSSSLEIGRHHATVKYDTSDFSSLYNHEGFQDLEEACDGFDSNEDLHDSLLRGDHNTSEFGNGSDHGDPEAGWSTDDCDEDLCHAKDDDDLHLWRVKKAGREFLSTEASRFAFDLQLDKKHVVADHSVDQLSNGSPVSKVTTSTRPFSNNKMLCLTSIVQPDTPGKTAVQDPCEAIQIIDVDASMTSSSIAIQREAELFHAFKNARSKFVEGAWINDTALFTILSIFQTPDSLVCDSLLSGEPQSCANHLNKIMSSNPRPESIIIPVHSSNNGQHWALGVVNIKSFSIQYFDSCANSAREALATGHLQRIASALELDGNEEPDWRTVRVECPQQDNSFDCGIHVLVMAMCLMAKIPLPDHINGHLWRQIFRDFFDDRMKHLKCVDLLAAQVQSEGRCVKSQASDSRSLDTSTDGARFASSGHEFTTHVQIQIDHKKAARLTCRLAQQLFAIFQQNFIERFDSDFQLMCDSREIIRKHHQSLEAISNLHHSIQKDVIKVLDKARHDARKRLAEHRISAVAHEINVMVIGSAQLKLKAQELELEKAIAAATLALEQERAYAERCEKEQKEAEQRRQLMLARLDKGSGRT